MKKETKNTVESVSVKKSTFFNNVVLKKQKIAVELFDRVPHVPNTILVGYAKETLKGEFIEYVAIPATLKPSKNDVKTWVRSVIHAYIMEARELNKYNNEAKQVDKCMKATSVLAPLLRRANVVKFVGEDGRVSEDAAIVYDGDSVFNKILLKATKTQGALNLLLTGNALRDYCHKIATLVLDANSIRYNVLRNLWKASQAEAKQAEEYQKKEEASETSAEVAA